MKKSSTKEAVTPLPSLMIRMFCIIFFLLCIGRTTAQNNATSERYDKPARFEFREIDRMIYLRLDSKTGRIVYIDNNDEPITVNGKDLSNGGESENGRFRIIKAEFGLFLFDTSDGRLWQIVLTRGKPEKCFLKERLAESK